LPQGHLLKSYLNSNLAVFSVEKRIKGGKIPPATVIWRDLIVGFHCNA